MRLKLTIAYDGTDFRGWQSQKSADSIQDIIEKALLSVCGTPIRLHGAGRTDSGVHARAQIAHADVTARLTPAQWIPALNTKLPQEIRILRASFVSETFHARFSAKGKEYRYEIFTGNVLPPHLARTTWHYFRQFDIDRLHAALKIFIGTHDFAAFSANRGNPVEDTRRNIRAIRVMHRSSNIRITYIGEGFLYKMVRMLTAAAFRVASGRDTLATLRQSLADPAHSHARDVAPAHGLTLVRVIY